MSDLDPVLKTIIAEALGEGPEGMRLVGETIVNRSQQRGIDPSRVVSQPYQYTGYSNPGPAAQRAFNDPRAISAAQAAWQLAQGPGDPTGGANHYFAPGTISTPSWARSMTPTLTQGGHAFYTDRSGFQQRAIPAVAPTPSRITPSSAALRQMTSPSGGNTALQSALNQYAANRATAQRNQVTPKMPAWLSTGMNQPKTMSGPLSSAAKSAAALAALSMNQSYVGQDRAGPQVLNKANATNDAARRAVLSMGGNQTYAGQSAAGSQLRKPSAFGAFPQGGQMPQAAGSFNYAKDPSRLTSLAGLPAPTMINNMGGRVANVPLPKVRPANTAAIMPMGANMRPSASFGIQPSAARVAPVPLQRPNFGMGGPGFAPVNAASMAQAQAQVRPPLNVLVQGASTIQPPPMIAMQPTALQRAGTQSMVGGNENNGPTLTSRGTILGSGPGYDDGSWAKRK